jgi:hypothetical protein
MLTRNRWNFIAIVILLTVKSCNSSRPNILLVLTDDQDLLLKSLEYLPKIDKLLTSKGAIFSNAVS